MSKAFTKEPGGENEEEDCVTEEVAHAPISTVKNYITPSGLQRLRDERRFLLTRERPAVTQVVAWAASNGDRSENADYQYGKRRLREIDRRIRFLTKRIDAAEVVDPEAPRGGRAATQVFFGATVRYANAAGTERVVSVVGLDEVDLDRNHIS
jgi:transcription elongation factor GreB